MSQEDSDPIVAITTKKTDKESSRTVFLDCSLDDGYQGPLSIESMPFSAAVKDVLATPEHGEVRTARKREALKMVALPPMHVAAMNGDIKLLESLLAEKGGLQALNAKEPNFGRTPLHVAATAGVVKLLVNSGADVFARDNLGNTALHAAADRNDDVVVSELLCVAEDPTVMGRFQSKVRCIDCQNEAGNTALHIAAEQQLERVAQIICFFRPNVNITNNESMTALHLAAQGNSVETVRILLSIGAPVNARDSIGHTALHYAADSDYIGIDICKVLIEYGCSVDAAAFDGKKAVDLAVDSGHQEKAAFIESQGGDIMPMYLNKKKVGKVVTIPESVWRPPYARSSSKLERLCLDLGDRRKLDPYGFEIPDDAPPAKTETPEQAQKQRAAEKEAEKKLSALLDDDAEWNRTMRKNVSVIKERCYKGLPLRLRGKVWMKLLKTDKFMNGLPPGYYEKLLCEKSPMLSQIDTDIKRTFRNNEMFRERYGPGQRSVFNILRAYSVYDKDVGFVQGMTFLSSILVLFMPEEEAFWTFVQLLQAPEFGLRALFLPGFDGMHMKFHCHSKLIEQFLPKLHSHFESQNMRTVFYASKWYLTLFADCLPVELMIRVWDVIFFEGVEFLFTISLRILELLQRRLLEMPFVEMVQYLTDLHHISESPDTFIAFVTRKPVPHAMIDKYRLEFTVQSFKEVEEEKEKERKEAEAAAAKATAAAAASSSSPSSSPPVAVSQSPSSSPSPQTSAIKKPTASSESVPVAITAQPTSKSPSSSPVLTPSSVPTLSSVRSPVPCSSSEPTSVAVSPGTIGVSTTSFDSDSSDHPKTPQSKKTTESFIHFRRFSDAKKKDVPQQPQPQQQPIVGGYSSQRARGTSRAAAIGPPEPQQEQKPEKTHTGLRRTISAFTSRPKFRSNASSTANIANDSRSHVQEQKKPKQPENNSSLNSLILFISGGSSSTSSSAQTSFMPVPPLASSTTTSAPSIAPDLPGSTTSPVSPSSPVSPVSPSPANQTQHSDFVSAPATDSKTFVASPKSPHADLFGDDTSTSVF